MSIEDLNFVFLTNVGPEMDVIGQLFFLNLVSINILIYPWIIIKSKQKLRKIISPINKSYSKLSVWIIKLIIFASIEQIIANSLLLILTFYTWFMDYQSFEEARTNDIFIKVMTYVLNLILIGVIGQSYIIILT